LTIAGAMTYPLYLIHEYIGWTVLGALDGALPEAVTLVGLVAAMLGAAWLIHRYVERPLASAIRRGIDAVRSRTAAPEPVAIQTAHHLMRRRPRPVRVSYATFGKSGHRRVISTRSGRPANRQKNAPGRHRSYGHWQSNTA